MPKRKNIISKEQLKFDLDHTSGETSIVSNEENLTQNQKEVLDKYGISVDELYCRIDEKPSPDLAFSSLGISDNDFRKYYESDDNQVAEPNEIKRKGANAIMAVGLTDRATNLSSTLERILHASKMFGLLQASDSEAYDIDQRVNSDIIDSAPKSAERDIDEAKQLFYRAFGLIAMINAGVNYSYFKKEANQAFIEFYKSYTGPESRSKRDKFRRKLIKQKN